MFSLDELREIRRNYLYYPDTRELKLQIRAKGDPSVKQPDDLTQDEKSKIISALYVSKIVRDSASGNGIVKARSEQEILDEIQSDFYKQILTPGKKSIHPFKLMAGKTEDIIIMDLAHPNEEKRNMAEIYFKYILSEHGKKATNIHRSVEGKQIYTISYNIEDLEKKKDFRKQLDPNNPIYTQPQKKINLTPDQLAHRRKIVERLIADYKKMEHDEWYKIRAQKEDSDMQRIANVVNKNEIINSSIKGPGLFRLLIVAQNLSLDGEQNFLEEMLKQPAVNDALLELKKSGQVHTIHTEAEENEKNGKVNANGLLEGHSLTHCEITIREANKFIGEHPNAVSVARKKLSERNSFLIKHGNTETMKKARLVEVVARTQGKSITRTTDENGNRILQVDDEKEQSK